MGKWVKIFFQLLHSDPFVQHWYCDAEGYTLCTLRYLIVESFRKMGLQEAKVFIPPHHPCTFEGEDMSRSSEERIHDFFINQGEVYFFARQRMKERSITSQTTRYPTGAAGQAKRSSRTTSFGEGMEAPVPGLGGLGRLSKRDTTKPLPARWSSTSSTTRPSLGSAAEAAQTLPSPSQAFGRSGPSHLTIDPQSQQPTPPGVVRPLLPTSGVWSNVMLMASWAPCPKVNPSAISICARTKARASGGVFT